MALNGDLKPPFTLEQIVFLFRQRMDDLPGDVVPGTTPWQNDDDGLLWKNEEACGFVDEAQHELAHRKPILDSTTAAITEIAVAGVMADVQEFTYDQRILKIDRIKFVETLSADETVLVKRTPAWMDFRYRNWDLETPADNNPGVPEFYVEYTEERKLQLWPPTNLDATLFLTVWRLPLVRLSWTLRRSLIEAQEAHQMDLIDWMQYRAYMKRDAETENLDLAATHKGIFDERIGPRPSAALQALRRREHKLGRRVQGYFV
jgi:hypothetical protein